MIAPALLAAEALGGLVVADRAGAETHERSVLALEALLLDAMVAAGVELADQYAPDAAQVLAGEAARAVAAVVAEALDTSGQPLVRRYYVADHLGSVRAVVDTTGAVVEARDYAPWGLVMPGRVYVQGSETREGFTGHELDRETGLVYAGARYYLPELGRWTSVDPLADEFPGWSPYNYVMNSPVGLVDPDGRAPCDPPYACNGWQPALSFGQAAFDGMGEAFQKAGDAIAAGGSYVLGRLTGAADARTAPERYQDGGRTVREGIGALREGNIREGLNGMATGLQQRADAVGDGAGFVENATVLGTLTGNPVAIGTYGVASLTSTTADVSGGVLEAVRWGTGNGSGLEAIRRLGFAAGNALLPVRISPNSEVGQAGVSILINEADQLTQP